jgi:hypothetical protein
MQVIVTQSVQVKLILDENESRILKSMMQNFMGDSSDEPSESREFREKLFDLLHSKVPD